MTSVKDFISSVGIGMFEWKQLSERKASRECFAVGKGATVLLGSAR